MADLWCTTSTSSILTAFNGEESCPQDTPTTGMAAEIPG